MDLAPSLFNKIARSHAYWGRKPLVGLLDAFRDLGKESVLLDPFCGGGTALIAGLRRGARVIASDINPMAVFLTKVMLRPLSIPKLDDAFNQVSSLVAEPILNGYAIACPKCHSRAHIDSVVWSGHARERHPERLSYECPRCGPATTSRLSQPLVEEQIRTLDTRSKHWYPDSVIHGARKASVPRHAQLFTGRNLAALAELFEAIQSISSAVYREALEYVFTAILYSCSEMQMFSERDPSSSRGWYALRYYTPPRRKEKNVWKAFEDRYHGFQACKREINRLLPSVQITDSATDFFDGSYGVLLTQEDVFSLADELLKAATHIFLDPPYVQDLEYLALSELWGSWLRMKFDFAKEWKAGPTNLDTMRSLLARLKHVAQNKATIVLAFGSEKNGKPEDGLLFKDCGYHIQRSGAFFCDNSQGRSQGGKKGKCQDRFFVLSMDAPPEPEPKHAQQQEPVEAKQWTLFYLRVAAFRWPEVNGENLRVKTSSFIPVKLQETLRTIDAKEIRAIQRPGQARENNRAYKTLCARLIGDVLATDGWDLVYTNPSHVPCISYPGQFPATKIQPPNAKLRDGAFTCSRNNLQIVFCFDTPFTQTLKRLARRVVKVDEGKYETVCALIVSSAERMREVRQHEFADIWPRGFFMSYAELVDLRHGLASTPDVRFYPPLPEPRQREDQKADIRSFHARVLANIQVGGSGSPYRKLWFESTELQDIVPGQFIMMDTRPKEKIRRSGPDDFGNSRSGLNLRDSAYLKRPFGIHRAFYEHFRRDHLRYLALPPNLARILRTVQPYEFDIFYKVLPNGKGTKEMVGLKRDDRVEMIGPLGRRFDLRTLRDEGVSEIHVVGGGVGMAPLVFLVQALRFFSFDVVAFIGIERLEILQHEDPMEASYMAHPKDMKIYIDDLAMAGVDLDNIYVACDVMNGSSIPPNIKHLDQGHVSTLYQKYLAARNLAHPQAIRAFACGPREMMKAVHALASDYKIPLKVLVEKRMACGFGVCLSCVCKTRRNGNEQYSRVCTDGPIFEADEIVW